MQVEAVSRKSINETERLKKIALSLLPSLVLRELPPIIFASTDKEDRLGYYDPKQRIIVLSENLLLRGNERNIDSIFLHELSHAEDYARRGFSRHDETFKAICKEMGVEEGFEKAKVQLEREKREKAKDKIEKLIHLSESPFENESSQALLKAQRLMAEYGITHEDEDDDTMLYKTTLMVAKRFHYYEKVFFSIIVKLAGVYIIKEQKSNGYIYVNAYGTVDQVVFASETFDFLCEKIEESLSDAERKEMRRIDAHSFYIGLSNALYQRLCNTEDESVSKALALSYNDNAERFQQIFSNLQIKRTRRSIRTSYQSRDAFEKGEKAASGINVPTKEDRKSKIKKIESDS